MNPKISIVIPCFNMGDTVTEAISSVLAYRSPEEIEIIVINDGSNDNGFTKNILDSYKQDNIKVIHQANKGLGHARNTGIKFAKAPYIIPLDADNKIRMVYLEKGIAVLEKHPEIGVVYGMNKKMGLRNDIVEVGPFEISKLLVKNYIDACIVLRKSAWQSVNGYDEHMPIMGYEDWDINLRLFFKGWEFYFLEEVCFDYMVRENSMLVTSNNNRDVLLSYMFHKPELKRVKVLRDQLILLQHLGEEIKSIKKRKIIKIALQIEKPLKKIFNSIFN